jgi:hypothetical protein
MAMISVFYSAGGEKQPKSKRREEKFGWKLPLPLSVHELLLGLARLAYLLA